MNSYRDYSKKQKETPKKIPIGRFLILGILIFLGYKYWGQPQDTPVLVKAETPKEKTSKKTSSSIAPSSSSKLVDIKVSRWENEDGTKGARVEFTSNRLDLDDLLDTTRVPSQWVDYSVLAYQQCSDTSRVKVRFNYKESLNNWSYECGGSKTEFTKDKGKWKDSKGCVVGKPCWSKIVTQEVKRTKEADKSTPFLAAYISSQEQELLNPLKGVVKSRTVSPLSCIVFDYSLGLEFTLCATWSENPRLKVGDVVHKASLIGKAQKKKSFYVGINKDGYSLDPQLEIPWPVKRIVEEKEDDEVDDD